MQCVGESDARRRLALACRGRVDRGHEDEFPVRVIFYGVKGGAADLRLVFAIRLEMIRIDADVCGDLRDGAHIRCACDFDVGFHVGALLYQI